MKSQSATIKHLLMTRLIKKGVERDIISFFVRDLKTSVSMYPLSDHREIGNVINQLGWDDIELDYQTFQLAKAYFETLGWATSQN